MSEVVVRANALLEGAAREASREIVSLARSLGLSGHAARVLYSLARLPEAAASDLILATGVPDSKIYYALRELSEAGLLETQEGKPRKYRMVDSKEAETRLTHMLSARHEKDLAESRRLVSLLEPLGVGSRSPTMELAYVVKGSSNVLSRARAMIASARKEVLFMTSDEAFYRRIEKDLVRVATGGPSIKLAVPDIGIDRSLERRAEIRSIVCACAVLVIDGQQILTINDTLDGLLYGITSTDETLVQLGKDYWDSPRCCIEVA